MPCFNAEKTIEKSIKSVLSQDYSNWELIIVDDSSTDNTENVISQYLDDNRIVFRKLDKNSGSPAQPRNLALELSKGELVAFLDSDDIWCSHKLSTQVRYVESNPNVDIFCSAYNLVSESGVYLSSYTPPKLANYKSLLINNSIGCLTALVRSTRIKSFNFPNCGHEDYALWLKLMRSGGDVLGIQERLANYTVMSESVSSDKKKLFHFYWNIYRNEEGFGFLRSMYLCLRYFINVVWFKYK